MLKAEPACLHSYTRCDWVGIVQRTNSPLLSLCYHTMQCVQELVSMKAFASICQHATILLQSTKETLSERC